MNSFDEAVQEQPWRLRSERVNIDANNIDGVWRGLDLPSTTTMFNPYFSVGTFATDKKKSSQYFVDTQCLCAGCHTLVLIKVSVGLFPITQLTLGVMMSPLRTLNVLSDRLRGCVYVV